MKAAALALACFALSACGGPPVIPQKGGSAATTSGPHFAATLSQPENPATPSTQTVKRQETKQTAAPLPSVRITETPTPAGLVKVTEQFTAPAILTTTTTEETGTVIGAAQKDTARETAARLASFKPVQYAGLGFLAFALACFHPVVRAVVGGGKTIPALAAAIGVGLIFGPSLFVGRETLVLLLVVAGLAAAYLLTRLSHKEGQLDAKAAPPPAL